MKIINALLPKDIETLEIHLFADEHIGDDNSDLDRLKNALNMFRTSQTLTAF